MTEEEDEQFADAPQDSNEVPRLDNYYPYSAYQTDANEARSVEYSSEESSENEESEDEGFLEKDLDRVYGQDWEDVGGGNTNFMVEIAP